MRDHTFMESEFQEDNSASEDEGGFVPNLVFVAMPFQDGDMDEVCVAIKDECDKLGLRATRVDENVGAGIVIKEITDLIEKAEFIIFDLTYERPNVYYELGYAHGVGNEKYDLLLIAREGTDIHFDIKPLRIQFYRSTEHLRSIVRTNLKEMIRLSRKS